MGKLGGGVKYFLFFEPYLGKIPILTIIFSDGLKPPTSKSLKSLKVVSTHGTGTHP